MFFLEDTRYTQLFPHIFGYSSFLSIFFRIFGANQAIPPLINVILSVLSMILVFYIGLKLSGIRMAFIASLLWVLFPSQTTYNMFVLSEPLYTTELLAICALILYIEENFKNLSIIQIFISSFILSLLLVLMNQSRPIAAIPLITLFIIVFITKMGNFSCKNILLRKILFFIIVFVSYCILMALSNKYVELRLGGACGFTPGYNIYVGFNEESNGRWNLHDSLLLFHYSDLPGWSAAEAQDQMFKLAMDRIRNPKIDFLSLFLNKFIILWGDDSAAISYASPIFPIEKNRSILAILNNAFYYCLIILSIVGVFLTYKKKEHSRFTLISLFFIGLTLSQLLVEVAPRYHYSGTIAFVLFAASGLSHIKAMPVIATLNSNDYNESAIENSL
ncbi:hypothetical protein RBG61_05965 [Paludicola sp. MB14-C6]|uniref:hypothetical protein n=1 Tax=Paludihabitans sp. MB14-C6 TaxID=3070656 RepID=UPI0027DAB976|nr:hypothetical protein [Paludicola sp. MB14-C6]WMJ24210.1 hypothetical protein RBG61_05965 [Paludicola sp. MB14-C6]